MRQTAPGPDASSTSLPLRASATLTCAPPHLRDRPLHALIRVQAAARPGGRRQLPALQRPHHEHGVALGKPVCTGACIDGKAVHRGDEDLNWVRLPVLALDHLRVYQKNQQHGRRSQGKGRTGGRAALQGDAGAPPQPRCPRQGHHCRCWPRAAAPQRHRGRSARRRC